MKELKFRVWDIERECYLDETELEGVAPDGKYILYIEEEEISKLEIEGNYILEQYTGLKDKNGKEIYEGDIVAVKNDDIPFSLVNALTTEKWLVRFNKHRAAFTMVKSTRRRNFIRTFQNTKQDDIEVIGNIHENDDLLEKK